MRIDESGRASGIIGWTRRTLADLVYPEGKREREALLEGIRRRTEEARADLPPLFHRLWGKAHDYGNYDKSEWKRAQRLLRALGIPA
jgi:hypothetical protein